mmetsp:Transcript_23053/g.35672  ORF Transcript_23053/g.35672 Transcript_23053/m.35672 type:complete len:136 (+) Transcript_23053:342-749(+)
MLKQTRNALLYSDLTLFMLDTREGVTHNDVALYNWLTIHSMKLESDRMKEKQLNQMKKERLLEGGRTYEDFESPIEIDDGLAVEIIHDLQKKAERKQNKELDPLEKQKRQERLDYEEKLRLQQAKIDHLANSFRS